jgi:hypothetical protein
MDGDGIAAVYILENVGDEDYVPEDEYREHYL